MRRRETPAGALTRLGDAEYLGIGMADALITRLGRVGELSVRPSSAVRSFGAPGQTRCTQGGSYASMLSSRDPSSDPANASASTSAC